VNEGGRKNEERPHKKGEDCLGKGEKNSLNRLAAKAGKEKKKQTGKKKDSSKGGLFSPGFEDKPLYEGARGRKRLNQGEGAKPNQQIDLGASGRKKGVNKGGRTEEEGPGSGRREKKNRGVERKQRKRRCGRGVGGFFDKGIREVNRVGKGGFGW